MLNAIVFCCAYRFIRLRTRGDWIDHTGDAFLLVLLVQYLAVGLPGVLGVLHPATLSATALLLGAGLWVTAGPRRFPAALIAADDGLRAWLVQAGCFGVVLGYVLAVLVASANLPPMGNDALTYHLPAAATWLQTGRIGLFETWFFNPANTYSPLAGSIYIAWYLAPLGNDALATFVQMPALLMLFFIVCRLNRRVGLRPAAAAILAVGAVLSHSFVRGSLMTKDDLYVLVFFGAAVEALSQKKLTEALAPWRVGVAVGLLMATKYTALPAAVLLALMIDAPFRAGWRWRHWGIALACVLMLAGPWYVRNWMVAGNPLFPVWVRLGGITLFEGLFTAVRSEQLRTWGSVWHAVARVDDALPPVVLGVLGAAWVMCGWRALKGKEREGGVRPLVRLLCLGPPAGVALFVWASPFAEARFLYPVALLLFVCCAVACRWTGALWNAGGWRDGGLWLAIALSVLLIATGYGYAPLLLTAALAGAAGVAVSLLALMPPALCRRLTVAAGLSLSIALALGIYVYWDAYLMRSQKLADDYWHTAYGPLADGWNYLRGHAKAGQTVAYANSYLVGPLMGFGYDVKVTYVPVRHGIRHVADLPRSDETVFGEQMLAWAAREADAQADESQWLAGLSQSRARYLFVQKRPEMPAAPELAFAGKHGERFERVFENDAAVIFAVR